MNEKDRMIQATGLSEGTLGDLDKKKKKLRKELYAFGDYLIKFHVDDPRGNMVDQKRIDKTVQQMVEMLNGL